MEVPQQFLTVMTVIDSVLMVVAVLFMRGLIRRNGWLGFRTKVALASDHNWRVSHAIFGRSLLVVVVLHSGLVFAQTLKWVSLPVTITVGSLTASILGAAVYTSWQVSKQLVDEDDTEVRD